MIADLRGLNKFKLKLNNLSEKSVKFSNEILEEIGRIGEQIAREEYAGVEGVNIHHETSSRVSRIVAEKEGLAYIEFGTGRVGEQSNYPKESLPKQTLLFESPKGYTQRTNGWEYYYNNKNTKRTAFGVEGWYHKFHDKLDATFVVGQKAGMQMYRTQQRLKNEIPNILKNKIKGDGKNV